MKILFDEDVPKPLAKYFPEAIQVATARQMGWNGKRNGELLRLAAQASFDAIVTLDRRMEHQQNPKTLPLAVIVLRAHPQREAAYASLIKSHVLKLLSQDIENRFYRFGDSDKPQAQNKDGLER